MTNEEMIVKLEEDGLSTLSDMEFITNALQENTKLKAEIKEIMNIKKSWIDGCYGLNDKLKKAEAEIEQLKEEIEDFKYEISEFERI